MANKIKLYIGEEEIIVDLEKIFSIDETNLTQEYAQQAALYGRFAYLLAKADYENSMASSYKDREYARCDLEAREYYDSQGMKSTEGLIKSKVLTMEDYEVSVDEADDAYGSYKVLRAIVDALKMKADMLVSLGAHLRAEYSQTGMNIREYDANIDKVKEALKKSKQV